MSGAASPPAPRGGTRYPWRVFLFLWLAGTLTSPLVVPYFLGLARTAPIPPAGMPDSTAALVGLFALRNAVVLAVAAGVGLLVARRIGLGAPYLESWLEGAEPPAAHGSHHLPHRPRLWLALFPARPRGGDPVALRDRPPGPRRAAEGWIA